jgi:hypothetical protein
MATATDLTKAEAARLEKLIAYAAGLTVPNATVSVYLNGGIRVSIRRHDVYGQTFRGDRYLVKRGCSDSHLIGSIEEPLAVLKQRLAQVVR